ncbi:MAG TPA: hypothetical protein VF381_08415 [Thermoanaerobaculia bacterium]
MEPQSSPADPGSGLAPRTPKGNAPQHLVFILISAIGLVFIGAGVYARYLLHETWVPEIFIAMGVATATPGVLSFLYRRYLLEDIKAELEEPAKDFKDQALTLLNGALGAALMTHREREVELEKNVKRFLDQCESQINLLASARAANFSGFYQSRRHAIGAFLRFLDAEHDHIIILGSSLLGLVQESNSEYEEARKILRQRIEEKVKIQFLLTHPIIADLRARQENRRFTEIGYEIIESLRTLVGEWGVQRDAIRLYKGTPTSFGIRTERAMLLNPYPYMKEAHASPCMLALKGGYFYDHYDNSHFRAFGSAMAHAVPEDLEALAKELPEYARRISQLLELGEGETSRYSNRTTPTAPGLSKV